MKLSTKEEAKLWLEQAESDFSALKVLFDARKYDLVCFLSQQSAEEALKAYLLFQGEEKITTHSILRLCELAEKIDPEFRELKKEIKKLTPYYIEARYPNALQTAPSKFFDENDASEAISLAEKALNKIKQKLKAD